MRKAHLPSESPTPQYFSRHYYDLAMLLDIDEGNAAATDFAMMFDENPPSFDNLLVKIAALQEAINR